MADITSRFGKLNLFSKKVTKGKVDNDDKGEEIDSASVAGGGHGSRRSEITKHQLRVSQALRLFMAQAGILSEQDAAPKTPDETSEALQALLNRPHIQVPASVADRSHPLPDYFISSSHNTYLLAHQLFGTSSATAYKTALNTGSRCVEIDAWDNDENKDEPKVTHGYTLVSNIPFRAVCETIRDVVDQEATESKDEQGYRAAPIMISLENHCGAHGQQRLVHIMREVWGERLLSKAIREQGHRQQEGSGEHVQLSELGSKIVVIVEYHLPDEVESEEEDSDSSSSEDEKDKQARKDYKKQKKQAPATTIIPELAELGIYAQSVKPGNKTWYDQVKADDHDPHHPLINVSEVGLSTHLPAAAEKIAQYNSHHLMRVYPKGTRTSSKNLNPVPYWGVGAQICALNWQYFGESMQLNEALFSGTDGYVLKPAALRKGGSGKLGNGQKKTLRLHLGGATDLPVPKGRDAKDEVKPYVTCNLIHPYSGTVKKKTPAYKQHSKLKVFQNSEVSSPATDPLWNEVLEWEFEDNELVFVRILVKSDDSFAANPVLAVGAVRLAYVTSEWCFIRMLDLKGHETRCSLLIRFEVT